MKKIYALSSCDTCRKFLKELNPPKEVEIIDIKTQGILSKDLDMAAKKLGSYELLFSKKAIKYRALGLHLKTLTEKEMRKLILEEYTFLRRPLVIMDSTITAGATKDALAQLKDARHG
jgi:arsenate reductase